MFDILLGPKFSNKCKNSVKCIKCRVETIRKKKLAMERYLKKDVADLVSTGHDANAFGRMDALLFEINQTSCYDMIEKYCCCILEHLPTMQKERECPKETVEAVATLIFAAARFSDLPELSNLRHGFTERYRTTMESYTNREFVEKLQKKSFPQDEKLRLMKDITKEFNIDWDVKSLEYKLSNPLAKTIDHPKLHFPSSNENYKEFHITDERREVTDRMNEGVDGRKTVLEKTDRGREVTDRRNEVINRRKPVLQKAEGSTYPASEVQKQQTEFEKLKSVKNDEDQKIIQSKGDEHHSESAVQKHRVKTEHRNIPTSPKNANVHPHDSIDMIKNLAADESKNIGPHHFSKRPPPYVKTIGNQNGNTRKRSEVHEGADLDGIERRGATRNDKTIQTFLPDTKFTEDFNRTNFYHDGSLHSTTEEVVKKMEHTGQQRQPNGVVNPESKRASNLKPPYVKPKVKCPLENGSLKPTSYEMYSGSDNGDYHKKTAFSVRRKHLEQGTSHARSTGENGNLLQKISTMQADVVLKNDAMHMDLNDQQGFSCQSKQIEDDSIDGAVYRSHRVHRTYIEQTMHGRRSVNATYDGRCDNEEEKMDKLLQHYSKKGVSNESGKARTGSKEPQTQSIFDSSRVPEKIIKDEQYFKLSVHTPNRTASLPLPETLVGRHVRSSSMQPDISCPTGERAHPRLPDYDDLAARIAALRNSL